MMLIEEPQVFMKFIYLLFVVMFFINLSCNAAVVQIKYPSNNIFLSLEQKIELHSDAQTLSQSAFDILQIAYQKTELGFYDILNIPPQTQMVSETEFKTYGWCFSVNNVVMTTQARETQIKDNDVIVWFYGFAHYRSGEWLNMCETDGL